jgi:hypothetical protein
MMTVIENKQGLRAEFAPVSLCHSREALGRQ